MKDINFTKDVNDAAISLADAAGNTLVLNQIEKTKEEKNQFIFRYLNFSLFFNTSRI